MDVLPNEILKNIIGFLDKDDLLTVRVLNKTWKIYAEEQLRRTESFTLTEDEDILNLLGITSCRNLNNTLPTPFSRFNLHTKVFHNNLERFFSAFGKTIQSISFNAEFLFRANPEDRQSLNKMIQLLMNTPNLEEVYFLNQRPSDSLINEYKLYLPKLKFIEFGRMITNLIQPILNAAPNVQEVGMEIISANEKWEDFITIFQSIATRAIRLKLRIHITSGGFNLQTFREWTGVNLKNFKELTEIPFKVTDLMFRVSTDDFYMTDLAPIQDFIQKHSKELKCLNIRCTMKKNDEKPLTLDLQNMENLKNLELIGDDRYGVKRRFEVNLEHAPLLKKAKIKLGTKLTFGPVPLLTSLTIQFDTVCEYFNTLRIQLIEENVRLQKLNLICSDYDIAGMEKELVIARYPQLNSFLSSQANNLLELKFSGANLSGIENLQFPKMVNLKKLKLRLKYEENTVNKIQLKHSQFPNLEFLELDTSLYANPNLEFLHMDTSLYANSCSIETLENVRTLTLGRGSCLDFEEAGLRFPKLKKLHIINMEHRTGETLLPFIFKNLTYVEDLYIEKGYSWEQLTGIPEIVNLLGKATNKSNILETSISNLGDMNALQNLKLGQCKEWYDLEAVSYLISCGMLSNLKFFEGSIRRTKYQECVCPFLEIIKGNNTKTKIHIHRE